MTTKFKIKTKINLKILTLLTLLVSHSSVFAAGLLIPKNSSIPPLELSEHHVDVVIEDGYAVTSVTQIFNNPHSTDLEALYSFPVPTNGALGEFTVWINGKPVTGEVVKKKQAREIYQQEKSNGNDVGLTEQNSFKTFETSVYPVRAGQNTKIQIRYYQTAEVDLGIGRWVYQLEDGGVDEEALAFWNTNTTVSKAFSFNFKLRSAYPIEAVRLPNHAQAQVTKLNDNEWQVSIIKAGNVSATVQANDDRVIQQIESDYAQAHPEETLNNGEINPLADAFNLNKDLVVYWKHRTGLPGTIDLVTYRPDENKKGTFMMVFTPGEELEATNQGADWNFVLDISGSMAGKFSSLVEAVSRSIEKMRPQDRFRLIMFNDSATEITSGYEAATPENIQHFITQLQQVAVNGGTNLYAGLESGLKKLDADRASAIILVTDGVANVGNTNKSDFFKLLEKRDVRLFTFIMGNSANQPLLEPLARRSGGFAMNVSNSDDIIGRVLQASEKLSHKAMHDVSVKINGVKVSDLTPHDIGSLYRGQQLVLQGHYWQAGEATVELSAKLSGEQKTFSSKVNFSEKTDLNPELERLWAYAKITDLIERMQDFAGEDHKDAITELALEYGLVTEYTSMLVLQEQQFQAYNIERNNQRRVAVETQAQTQRASQPVRNNRADKKQPMYQKNRPSPGGGSFNGLLLIVLLASLVFRPKT